MPLSSNLLPVRSDIGAIDSILNPTIACAIISAVFTRYVCSTNSSSLSSNCVPRAVTNSRAHSLRFISTAGCLACRVKSSSNVSRSRAYAELAAPSLRPISYGVAGISRAVASTPSSHIRNASTSIFDGESVNFETSRGNSESGSPAILKHRHSVPSVRMPTYREPVSACRVAR